MIRKKDPRRTQIELLIPGCGHQFHRECLKKWTTDQSQDTCPRCKSKIDPGILASLRPPPPAAPPAAPSGGLTVPQRNRGQVRQRSDSLLQQPPEQPPQQGGGGGGGGGARPPEPQLRRIVLLKSIFEPQGDGAVTALALSGYGRKRDWKRGEGSHNLTYTIKCVQVLRVCRSGSDFTDHASRSKC